MFMMTDSALYRNGERERNLFVEAISDVLRTPGSFIWLGLHESDNATLGRVQEEFGLHDPATEDARSAHQRPELEVYGDVLLIVLGTVQMEDGNIVSDETHLSVNRGLLISVQHGLSVSYSSMCERCERTPQLSAKGAPFVLYAVMDFVVGNYQPVLERLQEELE